MGSTYPDGKPEFPTIGMLIDTSGAGHQQHLVNAMGGSSSISATAGGGQVSSSNQQMVQSATGNSRHLSHQPICITKNRDTARTTGMPANLYFCLWFEVYSTCRPPRVLKKLHILMKWLNVELSAISRNFSALRKMFHICFL